MKSIFRWLVSLSLFASFFNALPAQAANTTYYVSTSGRRFK